MLVISLGLRILRILKPSLYADKGWRIIYTMRASYQIYYALLQILAFFREGTRVADEF